MYRIKMTFKNVVCDLRHIWNTTLTYQTALIRDHKVYRTFENVVFDSRFITCATSNNKVFTRKHQVYRTFKNAVCNSKYIKITIHTQQTGLIKRNEHKNPWKDKIVLSSQKCALSQPVITTFFRFISAFRNYKTAGRIFPPEKKLFPKHRHFKKIICK